MIFSCVIVQIYKNHTEQGGFNEFFLTFLSANIILFFLLILYLECMNRIKNFILFRKEVSMEV